MPKNKNGLRSPVEVKPPGSLVERSLQLKRGVFTTIVLALVFGWIALYLRQSYLLNQANFAATENSIRATSFSLTETARPSPTPIPPTLAPPTITKTPTPLPTNTPIPTITPTPIPTNCSTITNVSDRKEKKGLYLSVDCSNGFVYELGPISGGVYEIGPNGNFFIYCTNDGNLYASKAEEQSLRFIEHIRKKLPVLRNEGDILLSLTYITGENQYWIKIKEEYSGQSTVIPISLSISN